jgi:hypothetical protein
VLGSKLLEGGEAAKKQKDQLQRLTEALQEYQRTSGEAVSNDYVRIRLMDVLTARTAAQTVKIRENIKAQLAQAEATAAVSNANPGATTAGRVPTRWRIMNVASLQARLAQGRQGCSGSAPQRECRRGQQDRCRSGAERHRGRFEIAASCRQGQGCAGPLCDHAEQSVGRPAQRRHLARYVQSPVARREAPHGGRRQRAPRWAARSDAAQRKADALARKAEQARLKGVRDEDAFRPPSTRRTTNSRRPRRADQRQRLSDELQRDQIEQDRKDSRNRRRRFEGPGGTKSLQRRRRSIS